MREREREEEKEEENYMALKNVHTNAWVFKLPDVHRAYT